VSGDSTVRPRQRAGCLSSGVFTVHSAGVALGHVLEPSRVHRWANAKPGLHGPTHALGHARGQRAHRGRRPPQGLDYCAEMYRGDGLAPAEQRGRAANDAR
jgi:hypothetical protein